MSEESPRQQLVTRLMGLFAIAVGLGLGWFLIADQQNWIIGIFIIVLFCGAGLAMVLIPQHWRTVRDGDGGGGDGGGDGGGGGDGE